jgi:hypothetical protein
LETVPTTEAGNGDSDEDRDGHEEEDASHEDNFDGIN